MTSSERKLRSDAAKIIRAILAAADAGVAVAANLKVEKGQLHAGRLRLRLDAFDRIGLLAIGKAAAVMASTVEAILGADLSFGLGVTKDGYKTKKLRFCQMLTSSHPIPDEAGQRAAERIEDLLRGLNARDLLLVAISGGASALLPSPVHAITLTQKQKTTDLLLRAGADIFQLNAVRKHLSRLKGGRLAALAYPATTIGLLLSDVIGDDLSVIGSGLTAPDPSTYGEALAALRHFDLQTRVPHAVLEHLKAGDAGSIEETPKPGNPVFRAVHNVVVGSNRTSLLAAAAKARELGYKPLILSSSIAGEAREVGRVHAEILREAVRFGTPAPPPLCLLSGGETTVTVRGKGRGGRNQEFALAAAAALDRLPNSLVASLGTDGSDGPTDAAGAFATETTVARSRSLGLEVGQSLRANDSYSFFEALGDLIKTGPTGTNVMDVHLLLSRRPSSKR